MKSHRKWTALLLALLTAVCLSSPVSAAGLIDSDEELRLTVSYTDGDTPLSGARFSLYLVAEADAYGELTVTEPFSLFNVDIRGENDDAWRTLAFTLEGYVLREQVTPSDSGTTRADGSLSFPTGSKTLTPGLYLVLGERLVQGGMYYDAVPFLALLPAQNLQKNVWVYRQLVSPKHESGKNEPDEGSLEVLKIWKDSGCEKDRPDSVTVQLLRNGKVYDTAVLSARNNWRYRWTGLDLRSRWTVTETVPEGYTVEITREGGVIAVTNRRGSGSQKPGGGLPQTGQLWWPVPVLLTAGLALTAAGLIRRRRNRP